MQKKLFFPGMFSAILLLSALPLCAQGPMAHGERGHMSPPKNLQVLPKNISHDDLMKTMHGFTGALGVKCTFCHEEGDQPHHIDFASDAKPEKKIARTMLRMTHQINETYLTQVHTEDPDLKPEHVTCGTCHSGHSIPPEFVPPPEHEHGAPHGMMPGRPAKTE